MYAGAIGLPRTFDTFSSGQFSPMQPIYPVPIDEGAEPSGRPRPRRFQFPVGWNLPVGTPGTEGLKLANFQMLRELAEPQSILRTCIESVKGDIISLDYDVIPTDDAQRAMQGNASKRADFEKRKAEVMEFLLDPDPDNYDGVDEWLNAMLEDSLVLDAVSIYRQPAGGKGNGPMGSDLGALVLLDGSTIRPLLGTHGGRPRQPQPAYQQFIWGVPRLDLMDLINLGPDASLDELQALNPILEELTETVDEWSGDQLVYFKTNPRSMTPYGFGPVEQCVLPASIMQARMTWQWSFFQAGSLPSVFLDPGETIANAEEARQIQEAINMMGGDLAAMHQVIVLPPNSKVMEQKPVDLTSQFDEWMTALIAMPFGLAISDLGITPKVAAMQSPQASRSAAKVATDRSVKRAIIPRTKKIKEKVLDRVIQGVLGQKDMQWSWGIEEEGDSKSDLVDQVTSLVKASIETIDEARIILELDPLGLPETTVPLVFTATGAIPLGVAVQQAMNPPQPVGPDGKPVPAALPPSKPGGPPALGPGKPPAGGGKPPAGGGGGGSGAKPGGGSPSPAHAGSSAVVSSPAKPTPSGGKSIEAELGQLRRYLRRGGNPADFIPAAIPAWAVKAAAGRRPEAAVAAVRKVIEREGFKQSALAGPRAQVAGAFGKLGTQLQAGTINQGQFTSQARDALAGGFMAAYLAGAAHASDQAPDGVNLAPVDSQFAAGYGQSRADGQSPYISGFADDIAAGMSVAMLAYRAGLFSSSLGRGFEQGYVDQGTAVAPDDGSDDGGDGRSGPVVIIWHLGDTSEPCALCTDRDGQSFTPADLPGYPGDGGFGDLCEGGPNCGCTLEMVYGDQALAVTQESIARQIATGVASAADLVNNAQRGAEADITEAAGADVGKDFSTAQGFAPYDLEAGVGSLYPSPTDGREVVERCESEEAARRVLTALYDPAEYEVVGDTICVKAGDPGRADLLVPVTAITVPPALSAPEAAEPTVAYAGIALRSEATGRVLMLQRAIHDDDDDRPDAAAGTWEWPGGGVELDAGETPWDGAVREFREETGCDLPADARVVGMVTSSSGTYVTFVVSTADEGLPINTRFAAAGGDAPKASAREGALKYSDDQPRVPAGEPGGGEFGSGGGGGGASTPEAASKVKGIADPGLQAAPKRCRKRWAAGSSTWAASTRIRRRAWSGRSKSSTLPTRRSRSRWRQVTPGRGSER